METFALMAVLVALFLNAEGSVVKKDRVILDDDRKTSNTPTISTEGNYENSTLGSLVRKKRIDEDTADGSEIAFDLWLEERYKAESQMIAFPSRHDSLERKSYDNHIVVLTKARNQSEFETLKTFESRSRCEFLSPVRAINVSIPVMISLDKEIGLSELRETGLPFKVLVSDVQASIDSYAIKIGLGRTLYSDYQSYEKIKKFLTIVADENDKLVDVFTIGQTYEGRDIMCVRIGFKDQRNKKTPAVFIEAGLHGREWAAIAATLFIIDQLVTDTSLLNDADWYIVPVINVDGYEYSRNIDRFWKKNRSKYPRCDGVDLMRNFDTGSTDTIKEPCLSIYDTYLPFSENETLAIKRLLLAEVNWRLYVSLHSGGSFVSYPGNITADHEDRYVVQLAIEVKKAIEKQDPSQGLLVGSMTDILGSEEGSSLAWAKAVVNFNMCFMISSKGGKMDGFDVPPMEIRDNCRAIFAGIKVLAKTLNVGRSKILKFVMEMTGNSEPVVPFYLQIILFYLTTLFFI